ncbi:type I-E CRISPR-associated endoribonuclease Cas2 [Streptomyces pseudogriseolus]|uniref:type I-E CRISPR-associated endoribonuclease Cas2 n=1 Tax=Streptomyces pseudogriseolus TaxID=36817 RepID=UPI003FA2A11B
MDQRSSTRHLRASPPASATKLWKAVTEVVGTGATLLVHPATTEQGYAIRTAGTRRRVPVDFDGLTLSRMTATPKVKEMQSPS